MVSAEPYPIEPYEVFGGSVVNSYAMGRWKTKESSRGLYTPSCYDTELIEVIRRLRGNRMPRYTRQCVVIPAEWSRGM